MKRLLRFSLTLTSVLALTVMSGAQPKPVTGTVRNGMSPASQAPLLKTGMFSQGSQNLALGLAKTAASQLA